MAAVPFLQTTDISGGPPYFKDVGDGDRITIAFDAKEAVTGAVGKMDRVNLDQSRDDVSTKIEATTIVGQIANITVGNFVRGEFYVLSCEFTFPDGETDTTTYYIRCVA